MKTVRKPVFQSQRFLNTSKFNWFYFDREIVEFLFDFCEFRKLNCMRSV